MHFPDLTKRLITSMSSFIVLVSFLMFSHLALVKWLTAFFASGIASLGIWELSRLSRLTTRKGVSLSSVLLGSLTVIAFFLSTLSPKLVLLPFGSIFFGMLFLFLYHFYQIEGAIASLAKSFFSVCYVAIPIGLMLKILHFQGSDALRQCGALWFVYLLIVTKMTDVGAYFGGRLLGKRKLAPKLSPSKTVSGAVIGFFSALTFSCLFSFIALFLDHFYLTFPQSLYLGSAFGLISQIGDLGESLLKRDAGVKDSNRLPGLGGILDVLDSLLFTAPLLYFFLAINS